MCVCSLFFLLTGVCVVLGWPYLFSGGLFRISLRKIFRRLTRETGRLQKKYEEALGNAEYTAEYARKALECIHQVANLLEIDCPQSMERYLVFCSVCVAVFIPALKRCPPRLPSLIAQITPPSPLRHSAPSQRERTYRTWRQHPFPDFRVL